jgi:2-haloacid dehalogenase
MLVLESGRTVRVLQCTAASAADSYAGSHRGAFPGEGDRRVTLTRHLTLNGFLCILLSCGRHPSPGCCPNGNRNPRARVEEHDPAIDRSTLRLISFDCYGTLIDWEQGILGALRVLLAAHGELPPQEELLGAYAEFERAAEAPPYRPYREVLRTVIERFGNRYGFLPESAELECLARSLPSWRPYDDTVPALRRLSTRYPLAVCSNIDDDLFEPTARQLEVSFTTVVTAQAVASYKPDPGHFAELTRRTGCSPHEILHVAQSLYHDIAPARNAGLRCVWLHRPSLRHRFGATPSAEAAAEVELTSMSALVALMGV